VIPALEAEIAWLRSFPSALFNFDPGLE